MLQIKYYRTLKNLTQKELAARVGVTAAYLSQLESGARKNPSNKILCRLSKELNVSIDALLEQRVC